MGYDCSWLAGNIHAIEFTAQVAKKAGIAVLGILVDMDMCEKKMKTIGNRSLQGPTFAETEAGNINFEGVILKIPLKPQKISAWRILPWSRIYATEPV